jgi:secreted trypsin-like serine protease
MSGLSACQETPSEKFSTTEKTQSQIIGGEAVDPESAFNNRVIYLALGVEKKTTQFGMTISQKGICTASALSSRILITAAHCVKGLTKDQVYAIMTTNPWNHALNLNEWIVAEKIKIHEKYVGTEENMGNDLALIRLSRDIEPQRISKLADASLAKAGALSLVSIGYGQTTALNKPRPEDNENDMARVRMQPTMLRSVVKTVDSYDPAAALFSVDQGDGKGICQGDSGGPGFIYDNTKQEFYILGVTTFVSIFSDEKELRDPTNRFNSCIGRGNYTNILAFQNWITSSMKELR